MVNWPPNWVPPGIAKFGVRPDLARYRIVDPSEGFMLRHLRKTPRTIPYPSAIARALTAAPLGVELLEERCVLSAASSQSDAILAGVSQVADSQSDASGAAVGGDEFRVNTTTAGSQSNQRIVSDAAGNFVVLWEETSNNGHPIYAKRYDADGNLLKDQFRVGNGKLNDVVKSPSGDFIITTNSGVTSAGGNIWVTGFSSTGQEQFDTIVNLDFAANYTGSQVVMLDTGFMVVFYRDSVFGIYAQKFHVDGTWDGDQFTLGGYPQSSFELSPLADGGFVMHGTGQYSFDAYWLDGSVNPTGGHASITKESGATYIAAVDPNGELFVVKVKSSQATLQRYNNWGIAQGGPVTLGLSQVSSVLADAPGSLLMLWSPTGQEPPDTPTPRTAVMGRRFSAAGTPLEPAFRINVYAPNYQTNPRAVSLGDGVFVATWVSTAQDGDQDGVYARRFVDETYLNVSNVDLPDGGTIAENATLLSQVPALDVTLSRAASTSGGAAGGSSITNPANWRLFDGVTDISNQIIAITYADNVARVQFHKPLRGSSFQIQLLDNVTDTLGRALDGNGDGVPGAAFTRSFAVTDQLVGIGSEFVAGEYYTTRSLIPVAVGPTGDFAVAWTDGLYSQRVRQFVVDGTPIGLAAKSSGHMPIDLEMDSAGNVTVTNVYGVTNNIYVERYDANGQLVAGESPVPSTAATRIGGLMAMDAAGNFIVTWGETSPAAVYAQRYDRDFHKIGTPIVVAAGLSSPFASPPEIAMSDSGDFVVAWSAGSAGATDVYAQLLHADGTLRGSVVLVNSTTSGDQASPRVAMDSAGNFAVVWPAFTQDAGKTGVYGQWFDAAGNRVGGEQHINTSLASMALPSVAMDAVGNALVTWGSRDIDKIIVQQYLPGGTKVGGEFYINTIATEWSYPTVAMNRAGESVVTWSENPSTGWARARRLAIADGALVDLNGSGVGQDYLTQHTAGGGPVAIVNADELYVADAAVANLVSATISIVGYQPGDQLSVDTSGTSISASFADGVLSLSGDDTVAHYQQVLRTAQFDTSAVRPASSTVEVTFVINDGFYDSNLATSRVEIYVPGSAAVAAQRLFYNDSAFDGRDAGMGPADYGAVPNKSAYLPGSGVATFANVSSYSKGINGIIVDLAGAHGEITLFDLGFRVGSSANPADWVDAPTPSGISLRPGAGVGGADRLEVIWPNNAIRNQWLEVRVKANAHTGLASDDLFYWGNRVGDVGAGTPAAMFVTSAADATATWNKLGSSPFVDTLYDFNRDGQVTAADKTIAMNNFGSLVRLNLGAVAAALAGDAGIASALAATTSATSSDVRSLPTAQESTRAAIATDVVTRAAGTADLMTTSAKAARLARATDAALSLEVGWDEPAEPLVDLRI